LIGKTSLVVGDSFGRARVYFPAELSEGAGKRMLLARELPQQSSPVVVLQPSPRSRVMAAGTADGTIALFQTTTGRELIRLEGATDPGTLVVAPKEDAVIAYSSDSASLWEMDLKHPEATLSELFTPVWYESAASATHTWQSAGGTDEFEPKLGLVPLVFGTLKGTLYSMLFGAPIALLAAIFSSEFLAARLRSPIKSMIELMAGLPSVVLGFLAALVIAPFVQRFVPSLLLSFITLPLALLLGAYCWQLLPQRFVLRLSGLGRLGFIFLAVPIGYLVARLGVPAFERLLFAGDVKLWLNGQIGSATGGWFYLLLPLSALASVFAFGRFISPRIRELSLTWGREKTARYDLLRFLTCFAFALLLAFGVASLAGSAGFDARGGALGTYVDRNALIVGFVMGFAIIPIIYTLADDALTEVPLHLREASLGAGATHWQTATRVVIPTAMSGLFSALMIGVGRAVGETMIVLMAAGNTAVMDWNVFNGFRTLSANIATELPEAVRNSTHYRTLFLAALVLFAMTFLLNSVAEGVRRHFRNKTSAL